MSANACSLAALGVTAEELAAREDQTRPAGFTVGWIETPDGDPIVGIVHQTDYRAEEETGIGALRTALTGTSPRVFAVTDEGRRHAAAFTDDSGIVLTSFPLDFSELDWGDPLPGASSDYAQRWAEDRIWTRGLEDLVGDRRTMDQLRQLARELEIAPMPRTKTALRAALLAHPRLNDRARDVWPAPFRSGRTLILRADSDTLAARVLAKLAGAVRAGTLGVGSASGPFHSGTFYYDTRDETEQLVADREAAFDLYDTRMAALEPVAAELNDKGHGWYFLGNPREIDGEIKYWLNGHARGRDHVQPHGWFTLEELRAEAFMPVS